MKSIIVIFVSEHGLRHELTSDLVNFFTNGDTFTGHVAIGFPELNGESNKIVEAVSPKVKITEGTDYDDLNENMVVYRVDVTDEQYAVLEAKAYELGTAGIDYGVPDCITGGLHDVLANNISEGLAMDVAGVVDGIMGTSQTMNCSELATVIFREVWNTFAGSIESQMVTPKRFFKEFLNDDNIQKAKSRIGEQRVFDILN